MSPAASVARLGGDEFGVLVTWAERPDVSALVLDVIKRIEQPIAIRDLFVEVGCTVGVGHATPGDHPIEVLMAAESDRDQRKSHRRHSHVTTAH